MTAFLGKSSTGGTESVETRQVWVENAIVDFRIYMYRYKSSWTGATDYVEDGLVIVIVKHALDLADVKSTDAVLSGLNKNIASAKDELTRSVNLCKNGISQLENQPSNSTIKGWLGKFPAYEVNAKLAIDETTGKTKKSFDDATLTEIMKTFLPWLYKTQSQKQKELLDLDSPDAFKKEAARLTALYQSILDMMAVVSKKRKELQSINA